MANRRPHKATDRPMLTMPVELSSSVPTVTTVYHRCMAVLSCGRVEPPAEIPLLRIYVKIAALHN